MGSEMCIRDSFRTIKDNCLPMHIRAISLSTLSDKRSSLINNGDVYCPIVNAIIAMADGRIINIDVQEKRNAGMFPKPSFR